MPYTYRKVGNKQCVYKKDDKSKVGCTSGDVNKYLAALHANANESENRLVGGKADKLSVSDIAKKHDVSIDAIKKQLVKGMKIESEHTQDKEKQREIAMDHLTESPTYYDDLEKMEAKEKDKLTENLKRRLLTKLLTENTNPSDLTIEYFLNRVTFLKEYDMKQNENGMFGNKSNICTNAHFPTKDKIYTLESVKVTSRFTFFNDLNPDMKSRLIRIGINNNLYITPDEEMDHLTYTTLQRGINQTTKELSYYKEVNLGLNEPLSKESLDMIINHLNRVMFKFEEYTQNFGCSLF